MLPGSKERLEFVPKKVSMNCKEALRTLNYMGVIRSLHAPPPGPSDALRAGCLEGEREAQLFSPLAGGIKGRVIMSKHLLRSLCQE